MGPYPALTTLFTPPSECTSHWTWRKVDESASDTTTLYHDYSDNPVTTLCYPNPGGGWANPLDIGTYSPAICPSGHTTAGLWWDDATTTAVCCQSGFTYTGEMKGCTSTYSTSTTVTIVDTAPASSGQSGDGSFTTYTSVVGPGEAVMFAVAVMYQPGDLYEFPSDAAPILFPTAASTPEPSGSSSLAAGATATGGAAPTSNTSSSENPSSSSLSTGAKVAIGVGSAFGAFVLLACIVFLFMMRKYKRRLDAQEQQWRNSMVVAERKDLGESYVAPAELSTEPRPVELDPEERTGLRRSSAYHPQVGIEFDRGADGAEQPVENALGMDEIHRKPVGGSS